jgi:hypothetical protein
MRTAWLQKLATAAPSRCAICGAWPAAPSARACIARFAPQGALPSLRPAGAAGRAGLRRLPARTAAAGRLLRRRELWLSLVRAGRPLQVPGRAGLGRQPGRADARRAGRRARAGRRPTSCCRCRSRARGWPSAASTRRCSWRASWRRPRPRQAAAARAEHGAQAALDRGAAGQRPGRLRHRAAAARRAERQGRAAGRRRDDQRRFAARGGAGRAQAGAARVSAVVLADRTDDRAAAARPRRRGE